MLHGLIVKRICKGAWIIGKGNKLLVKFVICCSIGI